MLGGVRIRLPKECSGDVCKMKSHDLYDQGLIESALQDLETRHQVLFDSAPGAMMAFEVETMHFLAVNDAAIAQYGYTRDEFLRMTARDLRAEAASGGFWRLEAALRSGHELHAIVKHA